MKLYDYLYILMEKMVLGMKILIIGGSSDIGINLAKKFKDNGHLVISTYNRNIFSLPGVEVYKCDVRYEEDIERVIKYGCKIFDNDFILINLANICMDNSIMNKTKKEFMEVLEVNLVGMFLCNQIYSRYVNDGMIINMASTDGIDTYSEYGIDYAVSKAGIIQMSKCIDKYTENKVICICPNWIDSDSTRLMNKEYLQSELERIGQSRLITMEELVDSMYEIIVDSYNNSKDKIDKMIRIDIRDDKLWIERI